MSTHSPTLAYTNHARERMQLRNISPEEIRLTLSHPDKTRPSDKPDQIVFIRIVSNRPVHVIAQYLDDQQKWLVISAWVRGEEDPEPLIWQLLTAPFKITAKIARIIISYIKKY